MPNVVITVDCHDPDRMAAFWAAALGYSRRDGVGQYRPIDPPEGSPGPKLLFQEVADPTPGKNRWHLDIDLDPGAPLEPEVDRLRTLGAELADSEPVEEFGIRWQVMADPEGNVFCVVATG